MRLVVINFQKMPASMFLMVCQVSGSCFYKIYHYKALFLKTQFDCIPELRSALIDFSRNRSNHFILTFHKLISRIMYFTDGDIFQVSLTQCLSSMQNTIHCLLEVLSKYKYQIIFLELKQQKISNLLHSGTLWDILKHNLGCFELYFFQNFVFKL